MFIVFGGASYYAAGGANDHLKTFDGNSIEGAKKFADEVLGKERVFQYIDSNYPEYDLTEVIDWSHVYSIETQEIIYRSGEKPFARTRNEGKCLEIRDRVQ